MMNIKYKIISLSPSSIFVICTTWERPDVFIPILEKELSILMPFGEIYFDFLINNGVNDRFYKAIVSNGCIKNDSYLKVQPSAHFITISNNFFINNIDIIDNSILTKFQKFKYKRYILLNR